MGKVTTGGTMSLDGYIAGPEESGFDLAEALHQIGSAATARVILISTHAEPDLTDMIEASPAVGFLAKSALSASAITAALGRHGKGK